MCQKFSRSCWDINPGYASAIQAWRSQPVEHRHADRNAPVGALVYFEGGTYGHATFSAGGTRVYSTDILRKGKVDLVDISVIEKRWGLKHLGWTDRQGSVVLPVGPVPAPPRPPARSTFPLPRTHAFGPVPSTTVHNGTRNSEDRSDVMHIQRKFRGCPVTGLYGPITARKVRAWQMRRLLKPTGRVGVNEWRRLGL